ncbi:MAG TPA: ABC transporter substrate-binding protein [Syntrophorhabdaceae bacterium]|nr:ABC transporter substrate-binding protein [Syntrophorhabdaceae bacterium]HQM82406.1 ABC transporter substrate-binding protein [Syntrophorhabdaceae bacterium]
MKRWIASAALLIFMIVPLLASAGGALDTINSNVSSVIDVMRDPKLKGEAGKKVKEQKIINAAEKLFDFVELSKRTLGLNWNKLTPEQRKEFVELYKTILKDAYIDKLTSYTDEKINYTKEVPLSENIVEVQSIVTTKKADVPINYRVIKKDGSWKVFDVIVEGVSLISNYRTQFREILGNNPPETLIDTLRKKVGKK